MKTLFTTLLIFLVLNGISAQSFDNYKWKNRLLLVLSQESNSELLIKQIKLLEPDNKEFDDRKLKLFIIIPKQDKLIEADRNYLIFDSKIYYNYCDINTPFKIVLIGLDGRKKLEQNNLLTRDNLFSIIDSMPMRRAELRKN